MQQQLTKLITMNVSSQGLESSKISLQSEQKKLVTFDEQKEAYQTRLREVTIRFYTYKYWWNQLLKKQSLAFKEFLYVYSKNILLFFVVILLNNDKLLVSGLLLQIQMFFVILVFVCSTLKNLNRQLLFQEMVLIFYFCVFMFFDLGSSNQELSYVMRFSYVFGLTISVLFLCFDLFKILQLKLILVRNRTSFGNK